MTTAVYIQLERFISVTIMKYEQASPANSFTTRWHQRHTQRFTAIGKNCSVAPPPKKKEKEKEKTM